MLNNKNIRNISIIAHVDHGKSTLADRFMEFSGLIKPGDHEDQILDNMDLERERGITIKSRPIRLQFDDLTINLIDTPGHVDFSYEVSRALIACDGAILLVDGTQGVQAQTFAHSYAAIDSGLDLIPVINKIDSVDVDIKNVSNQIHNLIGSTDDEIFKISSKTGEGVKELIQALPSLINPPKEETEKVNALIFDSYFDSYRGVVASIRVFGGKIEKIAMPNHYDYRQYRLSPEDAKNKFQDNEWDRIVAFQTRNPLHRAHVEMTLRSMNELDANLFLHPVVGLTKPGDVDHYTRVRCY